MLLVLTGLLGAELPPEAYERMKKNAEEVVDLTVVDVKHQFWIFRKKEWVQAKVTKVHRSKSGLKVGDLVEISYRFAPLGDAVGPAPIPQLDKGERYKSWISKRGKLFAPAAKGSSFYWLGRE